MPIPRHRCATRRRFLRESIAAIGSAVMLSREAVWANSRSPASPASSVSPAPLASGKSRVVMAHDEQIISVNLVQRHLVRDYLDTSLCLFTGAKSPAEAWHRILKPDDRILVKFNQSGATTLGTTGAVAAELVDSLLKAGFSPGQIRLLEAGHGPHELAGTPPPDYRWTGKPVNFGHSGRDVFLAAVEESTAIINVPFLKTHHRAVMSGCLKNLSHGLIRHPARFHGGGCDPAIGEIVASDSIRLRLKINIVNALRAVYRRGPDAQPSDITAAGVLLVGADPVACDAVGFGLINEIRGARQLAPLLKDAQVPAQLSTAARLGVGRFDTERIELVKAAV